MNPAASIIRDATDECGASSPWTAAAGAPGRIRYLRTLVAALVVTACGGGPPPPSTTIAAATEATTTTVTTTMVTTTSSPSAVSTTVTTGQIQAPLHRIAVRVVDGVGEFFDRSTGESFVPRGNNYIRLASQRKMDGSTTFGHALFDPGRYDSGVVASDLVRMHNDGYNVVRVFLSPDTMGTVSGGLDDGYVGNLVDFLDHAAESEMYVVFTLDWLPGGRYGAILDADCCTEFALMNANFLPPAGVQANAEFFHDLATELIRRRARTEFVLSYQVRNEMFFDSDQPPLSFTTGLVTTANGHTYDMASATDKEAMITEGAVFFLDSVAGAIRQADPTALVSVGLFVPHGPNPVRQGDPRVVVSGPVIWESSLDFVDLHAYAGFGFSLEKHVENFGIAGMEQRPIVMGEFGGEVSRFPSIADAAFAFRDWQVESCGFGFDGWFFWTWDLDEQPDFFNVLMEGGAINGVLAPVVRPDPCTP